MRELHQRDLYTELGEQIDATEDMESFLEIRLKMATMREEYAKVVAEEVGKNYAEASKNLEDATSKRIYWEGQLQKVQTPTQNNTATVSRTFVVNTNGMDPKDIDRAIQKAGREMFRGDVVINGDSGEGTE